MSNDHRSSLAHDRSRRPASVTIDGAVRSEIGSQLRRIYEAIPKGGIPQHLWQLLLTIERTFDRRK